MQRLFTVKTYRISKSGATLHDGGSGSWRERKGAKGRGAARRKGTAGGRGGSGGGHRGGGGGGRGQPRIDHFMQALQQYSNTASAQTAIG